MQGSGNDERMDTPKHSLPGYLMQKFNETRRPSFWPVIPVVLVLITVWTNSEFPLDYWLHVNNGRWMVEHHEWITTDTFSHTIDGQPVKNQPWLAQLMMFGLHTLGGYALNQFVAGLCYATALGVVVCLVARRTGNWTLAAVIGSLSFSAMATNLGVRPQYLSVVLFVSQLWLLQRGRGAIAPLGCFVIMALWTNIHGAFPLGVVLPALMLFACLRDMPRDTRQRQLRHFAICLASSAAGCFVRPFPQDTIGYVLNVGSCSLQRGLEEWLPTSMATAAGPAFFASLLVLLAILAVARRRTRTWELCMLLALCLLAATSQRMVIWWALAFPVAIARMADHVWRRLVGSPGIPGRIHSVTPRTADHWASVAMGAFALGFLLLCTPWTRSLNGMLPPLKRSTIPYNEPCTLTRCLVPTLQPVRTFAPLSWGSYLSWHSHNQLKSFLDSRVDFFPNEIWDAFVEIREGGPRACEMLDRFQIQLVICGPEEAGLAQLLRHHNDWQLSHADECGCVFRRLNGVGVSGQTALGVPRTTDF